MPANATVQIVPFFQRPSRDADGQLRSSFTNSQSQTAAIGASVATMPSYWAHPPVVVPALSWPANTQNWIYYAGLPIWDPRGPEMTFWGFPNAYILGGVSGAKMDLYFWHKPYGATALNYLGGWRWSNIATATGLWLGSPYPSWDRIAIWDGDVLAISLMAVEAPLVINNPFSIDIW